MTLTVVERDLSCQPKSCSSCGKRGLRLIPAYWKQNYQVCPLCARDLSKIFDEDDSWPEEGRLDGEPMQRPADPPAKPSPVEAMPVRPPGWPAL